MTDDHRRAISPLRRRMIDDMTIRGLQSEFPSFRLQLDPPDLL